MTPIIDPTDKSDIAELEADYWNSMKFFGENPGYVKFVETEYDIYTSDVDDKIFNIVAINGISLSTAKASLC